MKYRNKEWLYEQYVVQKKSCLTIGREINFSEGTIYKWLCKHGIPRRSLSEANKGHVPWIKGRKHKAESKKKASEALRGDKSYRWKGGRYQTERGYIMVFAPDHPSANSKGYVYEHRTVMERALGRHLNQDEIVHHINGKRDDNRLPNLAICSSAQHVRLHARLRKKDNSSDKSRVTNICNT